MSNGTQSNLDRLAARYAQEIISRTSAKKPGEVENTITKALGILQENGVYACFLYIRAKEREIGDVLVEEMLNLLDDLGFGWGKPAVNKAEDILRYITEEITGNLERLLLAKETLEQMLIYARYGAKARD